MKTVKTKVLTYFYKVDSHEGGYIAEWFDKNTGETEKRWYIGSKRYAIHDLRKNGIICSEWILKQA